MPAPSPTLLRLLAAAPALLALCHAHGADEAPKATEQVLPQIEIKASVQSYDERRNDTATKIVVTQEEILKNGDTTVADVLKRLPGITIGGIQGRGGEIRMRGLGSGYTQIMLNGEPSPPGFSLDSLAPDMIERIEIMRAATAEYTTRAIAGAINIVLKKAVQTGQREIKLGGQNDNGQYGANVNLQMSDRQGPLSYSLAGGMRGGRYERLTALQTDTGFDPAGNPTMLRVTPENAHGSFEAINFAPRVNLALGAGETLTSQSFLTFNRYQGNSSDHSTTLLGSAPQFSGNDQHIDSGFVMAKSDINWTKKLEGGAKLDAKFGLNWNHRDTDSDQLLQNAGDQLILNRRIDSNASDHGFTASGKFSTPYADSHALAIGWDGGLSQRSEERIQHDLPPPLPLPALPVADTDQTYSASVRHLALFAQDEWNVTPRWSVYFGLRWEGLSTHSAGNSFAAVDNNSSVLSPLFQTLWKLPDSKNDQLRFAITRTYKAPSTNSLIPRRFTSANNTPTSPDTQGNPDLKPELAWGMDLALEHYLPDGGLLSASTFVRRIEDITRNSLSQIDGLWVSMPVNDGLAYTRGIELEAKLPLRSLMKNAPAIEVRANLARNWSTISNVPGPNNRLDKQTPASGNLGLDYKMDRTPLTLGGNFSFQSGGPVRISASQTVYTVPKRSLDLYGLWKFDPKTQLRLSAANLLHQDNIAQENYSDSFGTLHEVTLTPTNLILRAMLEIKF